MILTAPQVPESAHRQAGRVRQADQGKGDVVVEFDAAQLENYYLDRATSVRTVDSEIVQTKASHKIVDEPDAMNLMTSEYNVQRSELEAQKAEILSEIEGAKNRIDVGITEGALGQVKTTIKAHKVTQEADLERLDSGRTRRCATSTASRATCRRWSFARPSTAS